MKFKVIETRPDGLVLLEQQGAHTRVECHADAWPKDEAPQLGQALHLSSEDLEKLAKKEWKPSEGKGAKPEKPFPKGYSPPEE